MTKTLALTLMAAFGQRCWERLPAIAFEEGIWTLMGTFSVQIDVGDHERGRWTTLDAVVDTGAFITSVPSSFLADLGVAPIMQQRFRFSQGEARTMRIGQTWVRVEGKEIVTQVLFNEEGTIPLLGALTLEGAFLGVDPVVQRLVPVDGLMA